METVLQSGTELLFVSGSRICLSDRGAAGGERLHGISVQLLCGRRAAGVWRAAREGGLRVALPVWTDTGADSQDSLAKIETEKNLPVYQISGACRVCIHTSGHGDELYGHGKARFLPVYLSGGYVAGRDSVAGNTRGAPADDRRPLFIKNGNSANDNRGLCFYLPLFLPHTLSARGDLWHHE